MTIAMTLRMDGRQLIIQISNIQTYKLSKLCMIIYKPLYQMNTHYLAQYNAFSFDTMGISIKYHSL